MKKEEFAQKISGRQYPFKLSVDETQKAMHAGLVVVYGASDDLMEFRGTIRDEFDCYGGGTAYFDPDKKDLLLNICNDDDCPYYQMLKENAPQIEAVWDLDGFSWVYDTKIPHAIFVIKEDDDNYCMGIVFSIDDLKLI